MSTATVSSKGQITLPVSLRKALNLKAGDKVELATIGNRTILTKARKGDIFTIAKRLNVPPPGPVLPDHEMDVLVAEEVAKHYDQKWKRKA